MIDRMDVYSHKEEPIFPENLVTVASSLSPLQPINNIWLVASIDYILIT